MTNPIAAARAWLAQDPDPETRFELTGLIAGAGTGDGEAAAELASRFAGRLEFGTAGLRAELGAGPMRMNRVVVAQAAAGLAAYLVAGSRSERTRSLSERSESKGPPEGPSAVIGYDGRHGSAVFARDAAELLAGAGIRVTLLPRALPTPVLAFAVRHLDVSAGVMITASHNPPRDNGMKVYLGGVDGGSQIVPPADADIEAAIARVAAGSIGDLPRSADFATADDSVLDAYVAATARLVSPEFTFAPKDHESSWTLGANVNEERELRIAYTAMHGVGLETARHVFAAAGLPPLLAVPEQAQPDPDFPTVSFPNPEEDGALDLVVRYANEVSADLIVANDPDADRLAIAVPDATADAGWRRLTGNDVGLLLGWAAAQDAASGSPRDTDGSDHAPRPTLAASLVSSPGLGRIAEHFGLGYAETLTGFKWISRVPGLVYGYEEALGYLVNPDTVRDKDGVSAAARFVDLAGRWRSAGRSVDDALDEIAAAVGAYASGQVSVRVADLAEIGRLTARLRADVPREIAGRSVIGVLDHLDDAASPADILRYDLADGSRVIVRPSGTEPKLKVYLDARSEAGSGAERRRAAIGVVAELDAAVRALLA